MVTAIANIKAGHPQNPLLARISGMPLRMMPAAIGPKPLA